MIPIRNLYYLLLYAWDALEESRFVVSADALPETHLVDLLASVLSHGVERLLRHGLDRGYLPRREATPGVRGKLDLSATLKGRHMSRAHTVCEFDELSHDVAHNRILKATLRQLLRCGDLDRDLHPLLRAAYHRLPEVTDVPLTDRLFRSVQLHRNIRFYRFLLDVCRMAHDCLIPDEAEGRYAFRDFLRNEERMSELFERFLFNFFRREQKTYRVRREVLHWQGVSGAAEAVEMLPTMRTDISLTAPGRKIVIDAKFYRETLQSRYGKQTVRSAHLYQLLAYLRNLALSGEPFVEGLLLYPLVNRPLDLHYLLHGHRIRIRTVDLSQPWKAIHGDLLNVLAHE